MGLTYRLFLIALIALLPAVGIQAYNEYALRGDRKAEISGLATRNAVLASSELERIFEGVWNILLAAGEVESVRSFETERCNAYFAALIERLPNIASIGAFDRDGNARCRQRLPKAGINIADRVHFKEALAGASRVTGVLVVGTESGRPLLPLALPLRAPDGSVQGVLSAALDLTWLNRQIAERGVPAGGSVTVADRNGTIIAREPMPERFVGTRIPADFIPLLTRTTPGAVDLTSQDGARRILGYVPIPAATHGVYISTGLSSEQSFASVNAATIRGSVLIALGLALAMLAAWLAGRLFVQRPVARLLAAVAAWRGGDLSVRSGLTPHQGEFGLIGQEVDRVVSEVQRREEALRLSEERLRLAVEATGIGIWDVNPVSGTRQWSPEFTAILGLPPDTPPDPALFSSLIHPDDREWVSDYYRRVYTPSHDGRYEAEFRIVRANDGAERWVVTTGNVTFDAAGRPLRGIGTFRDVTERRFSDAQIRESESRLRATNDTLEHHVAERTAELAAANRALQGQIAEREKVESALRQMQRLEAVGQLTSGIAHDFNNLLTVVLGNISLLSKGADDRQARRLGMMKSAAERGAKLTAQLLAFARRQRLDPRSLNLNETVSGMRDLLQSTIGGSAKLEIELAPELWPALVDATQIELVILNLAINGRDAMEVGGSLTIRTANAAADGNGPLPKDLPAGDYVVISVEDTGTGMSEEVLARAFEPFFTTKEVGKGSGLGLPQVYGFAKQSGGDVLIETELGKGTSVAVFLPRAPVASAEASAFRRVEETKTGSGQHILVIDDDEAVREVTAAILTGRGYVVTALSSGRAGLDFIDRGDPVDLLLVDFAMPGMNGAEFATEARRRRPGLPVVFLTGYADLTALEDFREDEVVHKPIREDELFRKVAAAMMSAAAAPNRRTGAG